MSSARAATSCVLVIGFVAIVFLLVLPNFLGSLLSH
jgi:hypothetical protein